MEALRYIQQGSSSGRLFIGAQAPHGARSLRGAVALSGHICRQRTPTPKVVPAFPDRTLTSLPNEPEPDISTYANVKRRRWQRRPGKLGQQQNRLRDEGDSEEQ